MSSHLIDYVMPRGVAGGVVEASFLGDGGYWYGWLEKECCGCAWKVHRRDPTGRKVAGRVQGVAGRWENENMGQAGVW